VPLICSQWFSSWWEWCWLFTFTIQLFQTIARLWQIDFNDTAPARAAWFFFFLDALRLDF
jgi:hypothetical protein